MDISEILSKLDYLYYNYIKGIRFNKNNINIINSYKYLLKMIDKRDSNLNNAMIYIEYNNKLEEIVNESYYVSLLYKHVIFNTHDINFLKYIDSNTLCWSVRDKLKLKLVDNNVYYLEDLKCIGFNDRGFIKYFKHKLSNIENIIAID
jgi:hypothetical protein